MKIWTDLSSILSQSMRVTDRWADGRTDGQTEFSSLDRVCISCSAAKMYTSHLLTQWKAKTAQRITAEWKKDVTRWSMVNQPINQ